MDVIEKSLIKDYNERYGEKWKTCKDFGFYSIREMFKAELKKLIRDTKEITIMFDAEFGSEYFEGKILDDYLVKICDYVEFEGIVYRENRSQGGEASTYGGYLATAKVPFGSDLGQKLYKEYMRSPNVY